MPDPISFVDWIEGLRMKKDDKKRDAIKKSVPSQEQNGSETSSAKEKQPESRDGTPSSQQGAAISADARQLSDGVSAGVVEKMGVDNSPVRVFSARVFAMGLIVSIGGLIV